MRARMWRLAGRVVGLAARAIIELDSWAFAVAEVFPRLMYRLLDVYVTVDEHLASMATRCLKALAHAEIACRTRGGT